MATDDATSPGKPATPSLLAGRTSLDERDSKSSRILANLEGRAAEPERQHLPADKKRPRRGALLLLLLLLIGAGAGLAYWRTAQRGSVMAVAQGNAASAGAAVSGQAPVATGVAAKTPAAADAAAASGPASVAANASAPAQGNGSPAAAAPSTAASITDIPRTADSRADEAQPANNPLSALASAAPAPSPYTKTGTNEAAPATAKGKTAAKNTHASSKAKKKPDGDAALLSALIAYGLPVPSKADNSAVLPGTPLAERLQLCRRKPFLESEQCRLQVCAGQWGIAPECPNPQAQTHN